MSVGAAIFKFLVRPSLWLLLAAGLGLISMVLFQFWDHSQYKVYGVWEDPQGNKLSIQDGESGKIMVTFWFPSMGRITENLVWKDHLEGPSILDPTDIISIYCLVPMNVLSVSSKRYGNNSGVYHRVETPYEPWKVYEVFACSFVALAFLLFVAKRYIPGWEPADLKVDNVTRGDLAMSRSQTELQAWDEASIAFQLKQLRDERPQLIPHYVESIKQRFIVKQDDRTAQVRLRFMQSQVEQLKLVKDFQQLQDDLRILTYEREKRIKSLELETQELDIKKRSLNQREQLEALREQRKLELEIAQLDQQLNNVRNSPKGELKLSPEEQRVKDKNACEARIATLKQEKQNALKIDDETERVLKVNAIDDAIQREMERWAKLL